MSYFWAIPLSSTEDLPRVVVSPVEKKVAETWLSKHGHKLPSVNAGDDEYISLYEFTTQHTNELTADNPDDEVTAEEESLHVAVSGCFSLESSGPLASSWRLIESRLGDLFEQPELSPSQWIRRENSKTEPKKIQSRGSRTKNVNSSVQNVWDEAKQELSDKRVEKFFSRRSETLQIFDATTGEFLPVVRVTIPDDVALDAERRMLEKDSPRPKGLTHHVTDMQPYVGPPLHQPVGPVRELPAGVTDEETFRANRACREWVESGDYDGLLQFRERIQQTIPACRKGASAAVRKSRKSETLLALVS